MNNQDCNIRKKSTHVLFIDSENNTRSRFAEEYLNGTAIRFGLKVMADSRGLDEKINSEQRTIAEYTLNELMKRGLYPMGADRIAQALKKDEAESYDYIIAFNSEELKPIVREKYPEIADHVVYWNIKDPVNGNASRELDKITYLIDDMLV